MVSVSQARAKQRPQSLDGYSVLVLVHIQELSKSWIDIHKRYAKKRTWLAYLESYRRCTSGMARDHSMLSKLARLILAVGCIWTAASQVLADEEAGHTSAGTPWPVNFELRFGVLYHEDSRLVRLLGSPAKFDDGGPLDLTGEILAETRLANSDNPLLDAIYTPALRAGFTVNTGGGTNHVNLGLAFDYQLPFDSFAEVVLGVAFHDGNLGNNPRAGRRLGCSPLSYSAASLGTNLTEQWRVMLTIEHLDNFELCSNNAQLTNIGLRAGFRL